MSSRDFGGSAIYGDNMPSNNLDDNHNQYQGSPIRINSNQNPQFFERSLIPTTIKHIMGQKPPAPDQSFCIDGKPVHQVSIIGIITNINPQSTHTLFTIDDQKCSIKCKLWSSDNDDIKELIEEKLKINDLVKVIGKVDVFKNTRSINIHDISKIKDHNTIALHGLEIILSYELNELIINQHLPSKKKQYQQWIDRAQNEEQQRKRAYQEYKQSQSQNNQQSPQRGHSGQGNNYGNNYGQNHNHNRNHNNRNESQSGGFHRNSSNRFVSHSGNNSNNHNNSNNNNHNIGDETKLGEWEKKILGWMRSNCNNGDKVGKPRLIIKKGVGCWNEQIFDKALDNLFQSGLIVDTIEDNWALTPDF